MKKFVVPEELLVLAKQIMDRHTCHSVHCEWHLNETCNCGRTADFMAYRDLLAQVEEAK